MAGALLSLSSLGAHYRATAGQSLVGLQLTRQPFIRSSSSGSGSGSSKRRMSRAAAAGDDPHMPPPVPGEHGAAEREKLMADGERRAAAAAARHRADPDVMEIVDGLLESVPPSKPTYMLRLLVARENADALNDDFFLAVRSLLTSEQFRKATSCGTPRAASIVSVFDSAWRAALEVQAGGSAGGSGGGAS
ncbi:hypothetical protein ABPG75_006868 [Micractinium tetrahymenae]